MHQRLVALVESMTEADFARTFLHPERGVVRLDSNLAMYAWHGRHHAAHILGLRERMGWNLKVERPPRRAFNFDD